MVLMQGGAPWPTHLPHQALLVAVRQPRLHGQLLGGGEEEAHEGGRQPET